MEWEQESFSSELSSQEEDGGDNSPPIPVNAAQETPPDNAHAIYQNHAAIPIIQEPVGPNYDSSESGSRSISSDTLLWGPEDMEYIGNHMDAIPFNQGSSPASQPHSLHENQYEELDMDQQDWFFEMGSFENHHPQQEGEELIMPPYENSYGTLHDDDDELDSP